jgi:hypothetical protein
MTKYEFCWFGKQDFPDDKISDEADMLGEEGWQMVSATDRTLFFQRQIPDENESDMSELISELKALRVQAEETNKPLKEVKSG